MGKFDADFADLVPADTKADFSQDFADLVPKDTGADFSKEFADLVPVSEPQKQKERPSAEWGTVLKSLPAQFVAGSVGAAANLQRAAAEESIAAREEATKPQVADPSGYGALIKKEAIEQQQRRLEEDRVALEKAMASSRQAAIDVKLVTPTDMTIAQEALSSLAQSAGPTLVGVAAGILTKNVPLAMAIAGGGGSAYQAGATYGEARDRHGAPHRQAALAATIDGILEGAGEALPLNVALKPGIPIFKRILGVIAAEAGQEAATQLAQDLRQMAMENPNLTMGEVWRNLKVAALAGAGGGAVYGGAGVAADIASTKGAANAELRAIAQEIEAVDVTQGTEQVAVELLKPERAQLTVVPRETVAAPQQEPVEVSTPLQQRAQEALSAIEKLAARKERAGEEVFQKGDQDRRLARFADKYFDELPENTQRFLMGRTARDAETGELHVIGEPSEIGGTGNEANIHGTHIFNLKALAETVEIPTPPVEAEEAAGAAQIEETPEVVPEQERAAAPAATIQEAETGRPFSATLLRGEGRPDSPYNPLGAQKPILGRGLYVTPDRAFAGYFGPNIAERQVSLQNPLVIENDAQWRALTRRAGWEFPNPFGQDPELVGPQIKQLRSMLESEGYDGVVVRVPEMESEGKTMQKVFETDQVIQFAEAPQQDLLAAGQRTIDPNAFYLVNMDTGEVVAGPFKTSAEATKAVGQNTQDAVRKGSTIPLDALSTGPELTPAAERIWEDIRERVTELARQITPTVNVRTIRSVWSGETQAKGRYNKPYKFIEISLTQGDQESTFRHEAVHALKDIGLFTPQEWRMLKHQSSRVWRKQYDIDRRYADRKLTNEQLLEEGIADAYGDYRAGTLTATPPVQRIMRKIKEFFERLGNLLRSMGFRTVEDVFQAIEAGEVGSRTAGEGTWTAPDGVVYALGPNVNNPPTPATRQAYVVSAQRALRQKMASPPANSWEADAGLLKRLLVTPRTIAAFEPDFVPVYQTAIDQWKFRDQLIAKFEREAEAYFKASPEDQSVVNKVLEHDRLTGQVGLAGQNKTIHFTSPVAQLSKPGERLTVTDEQKTAYWAVRSMLNMALDEFKAQTLEDFGLPANTAPAALAQMIAKAPTKAEATKLQHVADILQGIEDARRTGYVPFTRYGEIGISVRHPLTKDLLHYETIEPGFWQRRGGKPLAQMPEVRDRLIALRKQYPGMAISEPFQVPKSGMPTQVKLEEVDALAEMAKIDNATWDSVRAKLETAIASQGFRAHFFRAKNTPGYSADFERSLANYVNGISGYLARRRYARNWTAAIAPISLNKPKLRQYAQDYQKYVNSPAEEFGLFRSVNFVYYLTSVASWMVNLTQVPFVSIPWTTQFSSPGAVSAAFARAEAETAAMLTVKQGTQMYSAMKAPADVRAAVQQAYDQGLFIPITTYESMGIARNQGRRLRKLSKASQTAVEIFGLGFTTAERQNRISTFIALYRLARDNPRVATDFARVMAKNAMAQPIIQNWSPQAFAEFGIDETHFKAGKVNRPTLARNAGTLVFQFKMFTWNMIERLITMMVLQGPEGRASAALILWVMGMVAGLWGLPGAEDLRDLTELFLRKVKKYDVNLDAEMRKIIVDLTGSATLAEAVSAGAPRVFPEPWNIDLSKRVGMGNIVPATPGDALGVSYDLWLKRPMQAMEQYEADNLLLALAELSPKQAQDIMTQLAWAQSGVRTKATDQPVIPKEKVTPGMRVAKGIGFTPGTLANIREAERAEQVATRAANETRNEFYRKMAKAVADEIRAEEANDQVALAAATQREEKLWIEIEAWNAAKPDYLQIFLDRRSARKNLIKEFEGADYDRGARRQARDEIERLRRAYGR